MNRDEWSQSQTECMVPWCTCCYAADPAMWNLETHEIPRGIFRAAALKEPAAWLRVCKFHHEEMGDYSIWPLEWQYAIKLLNDPENYNRVLLNRIRDKADDAISEDEVNDFVRLMTR